MLKKQIEKILRDAKNQAETETDSETIKLPVPPLRVHPWLASLHSAKLSCPTEMEDGKTILLIPRARLATTIGELEAYEKANQNWPPPPVELAEVQENSEALILSVFIAFSLFAFHFRTGPIEAGSFIFDQGVLLSARDALHNWWRPFTALTLHADFGHVISNALALAILGSAAGELLGSGFSWMLIAAAGVLANTIETQILPANHRALGASTAVFAAVGILGAIRFVQICRHEGIPRSVFARAWLPLLATGGILGFFGSNPGSDLTGHLFGFLCGLGIGILAAILFRKRFAETLQFLFSLGVAASFATAWYFALR